MITLSNLIDHIHLTIIDERGKNDVILKELQDISHKIGEGEIPNYQMDGNKRWVELIEEGRY